MKEKKRKSYISNDVEVLADFFLENIRKEKDFFQRKIVVVPSSKTKNWLQLFSLREKKQDVFFGLEFIESKNLIKFLKLFLLEESFFPSFTDFYLKIQKKLQQYMRDKQGDELFFPLMEYLKKKSFSSDYLDKFSLKLSELFIYYGIFLDKHLIEKERSWQTILWEEIFVEEGWSYPVEGLVKDIKKLDYIKQIHLFNIDYLPFPFHSFLDRLSTTYSVYDYCFSPCRFFWEEDLSEYEQQKFSLYLKRHHVKKSTQQEIKEYLSDANPLLSNLGKLGREYSKLFEEANFIDHYEMPTQSTLLSFIKKDLLLRVNPDKRASYHFSEMDDSITFHKTTTRLREVEVLYDYIAGQIDKKGYRPESFLVLAPNISEYLSQIHMVFNEPILPYKIFDYELTTFSRLIDGILQFFSLIDSRWEKQTVLNLFNNPSFYKKHNFTYEEILVVNEWIDKANIHWGIDEEQRRMYLNKNTKQRDVFIHSWEYGFERILYGFAMEIKEGEVFQGICPLKGVSSEHIEIFDRFITVFKNMCQDIAFLQKNPIRSLEEISQIFQQIVDNYFLLEKKQEERLAFDCIRSFNESLLAFLLKRGEETYSFKAILSLFKKHLKGKRVVFNNNKLNGIHFASLDVSFCPCKIICLLGMTEDFPRVFKSESVNLLQKQRYVPQKNDEDRYAFLKALGLAKDKIYFSYSSEGNVLPSLLIEETINYLDQYFVHNKEKVGKQCIKIHPSFGYDKSYWQEEPKSYCYRHYLAAKVYYEKKKEKLKKQETKKRVFLDEKLSIITIAQLRKLAKHPVKFFFNEILNVYFAEELLQKKKQQEEISLSYLERYLIREEALYKKSHDILFSYEKQGKFPYGLMGDMIKKQTSEDIYQLQKHLIDLELHNEKFFSIDISFSYNRIEKINERRWGFPPIICQLPDREVKIVGEITNVASQGMLFYSENRWKNVLRIWPEFLIYYYCAPKIGSVKPQLLFIKEGSKKEYNIKRPMDLLSLYIQYLEKVKEWHMPLIDEWSEQILYKDKNQLTKAIEKRLSDRNRFDDPYLRMFFQKIDKFSLESYWVKFLYKTFFPLLEGNIRIENETI